MTKERILILGAGLAGLSAAWHLQKKGINCQVFEKESEAGGLCRSKKINGFTFDYDGHLLHFRCKPVYNFVRGLLGGNLAVHQRRSFVRYQNCEIPYPFQANFLKLPSLIAQQCLAGLKSVGNGSKRNYPHFQAWALANFGRGIARHFMLPYNEKFWGISSDKLSCAWLDGFIPKVRLKDILNEAPRAEARGFLKRNTEAVSRSIRSLKAAVLWPRMYKSYRENNSLSYNPIFYYPARGGIGQLPAALARELGGKIRLNAEITAINLKDKEVTINGKKKASYGRLISTLPLPELKNLIPGLPEKIQQALGLLNYNSLLVFNFGIQGQVPKDKHWVYFPEKKFKYFRMGFYHSFSGSLAPQRHSSIYVEVSYAKDRPVDKGQIQKEVIASLIQEGLISSPAQIIEDCFIDIKYGYPIYDLNYHIVVPKILRFLSRHNIHSVGRYGAWQYLSMEGALLAGRQTARAF